MGVIAGHGGCNFVTRQFDRFYEIAVRADATFHVQFGEIPSGTRTFDIKDLDGNLLTFIEAHGHF